MPIQVTCPKCFKRFQVSDNFAGKKGPCPNCKNVITVPLKNEEVKIAEPEDDSPKGRKGQSVAKPIKRQETDVTRRGIILTSVSIAVTIAIAIGVRFAFDAETNPVPIWLRIIGAIVAAPPLVWAGYSFVRDSELDRYRGTDLRNRVAVASILLAATWLVYAFLPTYLMDLERASEMSFLWFGISLAIMLGIGGLISAGCFELETFSGVIHAGFYIVCTLLLAVIAGVSLVGSEPKDERRAAATVGLARSSSSSPLEVRAKRGESCIECPERGVTKSQRKRLAPFDFDPVNSVARLDAERGMFGVLTTTGGLGFGGWGSNVS